MKRLVAFIIASLISLPTYATPPSSDSIEKLLTLSRTEKLIEKPMETMLQAMDGFMKNTMAQALQGQKLSPEGKRITDTFAEKFLVVMRDEMSWAKLKQLHIQVYSENFTQEEIDGLLTFYASPAGQAYLEKMPIAMQRSMALTQERLTPIMKRMQEAMKQAVAEARAAK